LGKNVRHTEADLNSIAYTPGPGFARPKLAAMNFLSLLFGFMSISVLAVYSVGEMAPYVIGQSLVSAEINLGIIEVKPITLFMYLAFLSYGFGLNSPISRQRLLTVGDQVFESLYVIAWFFVMLSGFEVLYQIVLWSAGLTVQGLQNPDIIVNWWPANPYAINVVFASKLVVLIFAGSLFSVDYMRRVRSTRERLRERLVPVPSDGTDFKT
jgi:hypothetical protein